MLITRRSFLRSTLAAPAIILPSRARAAFAIFQAASGSSVAVPAPAAAVGFNTLTFNSTFPNLNRVDINNANTSTASTDWWILDSYQSFVPSASDFGIVGGNMVVQRSGCTAAVAGHVCSNADNTPTLQTVYSNNGGVTHHGRTFMNGFYVEYIFAFDETFSSGPPYYPFPSLWADNFCGENLGGEHIEIDFCDFDPGVPGTVIRPMFWHDYNHPGQGDTFTNDFPLAGFNLVLDGVTLNKVAMLWVPASKNSGTGISLSYFNDVHQTAYDFSYSQNGLPNHPAAGGYNGCFYQADTSSPGFALFMSVGQTINNGPWPLTVKSVRVWQTSLSDMVVV